MSRKMLYHIIRRNRTKIIAATSLLTCIIILNTNLSPDLYFLALKYDNVTCYQEFGEDLLSVIDRGFNPPAQSIFFHETSCRGGLNSRQACAVEAAARSHKNWNVYVLFLAPVKSTDTKSFHALNQYDRIKFARINIQNYANNTPLESFVSSGGLKRTRWSISHTSDVLRYLTLYKWSGIYLDLDTVVMKPLEKLVNNWSARESDVIVSAGAMAFSKDPLGRMVAEAAVSDLAKNFRGDTWSHNGPGVITRVLEKICDTSSIPAMSAHNCQGFEIYGPELFYPIPWEEAEQYLEPGDISDRPYMYHVWSGITQGMKVPNNSLYAKLAQQYCPSVYSVYGDDFG